MTDQTHPDQSEIKDAFAELCRTVAELRHPETGCPWDLAQTHQSLRRYMIEEAYEAAEQMIAGTPSQDLCGELGDVLLQVVLNAQVASDAQSFSIVDVIRSINAKMIRRHPHVFGDEDYGSFEKMRRRWEVIKSQEKSADGQGEAGWFDGITQHPASLQAFEIGKRAKKINFDWHQPMDVLRQFRAEVDELIEALDESGFEPTVNVRDELGDVVFTWCQLCRHLGWDPETVAMDGNRKFLQRFAAMEQIGKKRGIQIAQADEETLEQLWQEAKKNARKPGVSE